MDALILAAGYGMRMDNLTKDIPKPLLKIKNKTLISYAIDLIKNMSFDKIYINTHYKHNMLERFISENYPDITISYEETILGTGGGTLSLIKKSNENDVLVINPDTIWDDSYINSINTMEKIYFQRKMKNILLIVNNSTCFDKRFNGDFEIKNNVLLKEKINNFKYTGCQIFNKDLISHKQLNYFPISEIWDALLRESKLYGYEHKGEFKHLTDFEIYEKLFI